MPQVAAAELAAPAVQPAPAAPLGRVASVPAPEAAPVAEVSAPEAAAPPEPAAAPSKATPAPRPPASAALATLPAVVAAPLCVELVATLEVSFIITLGHSDKFVLRI